MTDEQLLNPTQPILVYGRPGCPMVPPVRTYLEEAGLEYVFLNIREDPAAAARLRELAGGFESVPTVVLPDGRVLVEPGVARLRKALEEAGQGGGPGLGGTLKAGLSNPVYPLLLLIALALVAAVLIAGR